MKLNLKGKYIYFIRAKKQNPKTWIYIVRTDTKKGSGILLGLIKWYAQWRQYAFYPAEETVFEKTCLDDIRKFCIDLNIKQRKRSRK